MFSKLKSWIIGRVIIKKVAGKFAKHATGALIALFAAMPMLQESGIEIDFAQFEAWAAVAIAGLFGAAFNFIEHRFIKK